MIAFYPIKPIYIDQILNGNKKYELRKSLPSNNIEYILIYSTYPVAKVVAYAKVKTIQKKYIEEMWSLVSASAGISKNDYMEYFNGNEYACAIELENIKRFKRPFDIKEINQLFRVPQSFCYVNKTDFMRLKRRRTESV